MSSAHGTHSAYVQGCRCDDCKTARREYMRDYRARKANPNARQHRCPSCTCQKESA
ncbi:hypothetical protein NOK12_16760 [Nocardioides sp. OK12]|nr:hypothetical protein NOK12_16760 [Nocardioides sp. OK12]